jgi:cell division septation protein DedD
MQTEVAMATVPEHIKNLLFEQDCVVIPDFGGFIANFHSAALHANGSVLPPRRRLVFNEVLKFDDGLLSSYVALVENRSRDEALQRIRSFTEHLKTELRRQNHYRFESLGAFTLNREGKLVFEPDDRINFHADSYGFVPIFPKFFRKYEGDANVVALPIKHAEPKQPTPILEPEIEEVPVVDLNSQSARQVSWTSVAAACAILVLGVVAYQFMQSSTDSLSSLNPFNGLNLNWFASKKTEQIVSAKPAPAIQSNPTAVSQAILDKKPEVEITVTTPYASEPKTTLKAPIPAKPTKMDESKTVGPRFYVIVGGFKKVATAAKLKRELVSKGYEQASVVVPQRKGLVKVAASTFDSSEEATELARQIGTRFGAPAWVLKQ